MVGVREQRCQRCKKAAHNSQKEKGRVGKRREDARYECEKTGFQSAQQEVL